MKTKCYLCIAFSFLTGLFSQTANAQANTELSNLVSPTKVNQSLLPITDNSKSLGSASIAWGSIYLAGSVYLDGRRFLTNGFDSTDVFVGTDAGNKRSTSHTGKYNTASGYKALYSYTTGSYNTTTGAEALYGNTTGYDNTANGYRALRNNTTGIANTASGSEALYSNTTGGFNTATGLETLYSNTTGGFNTAIGSYALSFNSTGSSNTATGAEALYLNTTGYYNTANGAFALSSSTTGYYNTANGYSALISNTTGYGNTANGYSTGSYNDNNTYCTFIGLDADQSVTTNFTNSTALGYISRITASNQVRIGSSSVTSIGGYEPWTNLSDGRFKKNVKENVPGLAFINQLNAVTYTMDVTKLRSFLGEDRQNETTTADGEMVREKNPEAEASIQKGIREKEKIIRTGFVAQEVEAAAKRIGYDFSGVDKPQNEHTPYGLRYSEFVVPLVKAVQELSKMNDDLKSEIKNLKSEIAELKSTIVSGDLLTTNLSGASLIQNVPNPFTNNTTIHYTLPEKSSSAKITITDKNGKTLKEMNISGVSKGTLNVNAAMLSPGAYQYSLYIDGRLADTKQMLRLK